MGEESVMGGWGSDEKTFQTKAEETVRQAMMEDAARRMKEELDMQEEFCGGDKWTNAEMSAMLEREGSGGGEPSGQVVHTVTPGTFSETATAAQTRIAKAVLEENYPDGIPYGKGEVKKAFGLLDRAFTARAKYEKLTTVNPPSERKWRDIKNGKY